jgi:hypothetical protein
MLPVTRPPGAGTRMSQGPQGRRGAKGDKGAAGNPTDLAADVSNGQALGKVDGQVIGIDVVTPDELEPVATQAAAAAAVAAELGPIVAQKADQTVVDTLATEVAEKANQADVDEALSSVASSTALEAVEADVDTRVAKGSLLINVQDFGATGNDQTDDAAAIQAAIDASAPGAVIYFPIGTYIIGSTLSLRGQRTYVGGTREHSVLKMKAGANLHAIAASRQWLDTGAAPEYSQEPAAVMRLGFDGDRASQTAGDGHGLVTFGIRWRVIDVLAQNCRGDGVRISATRRDNAEPTLTTNVECKADSCLVRNCSGDGIRVYDPTGGSGTTDGWMLGNIVQSVGGDGIHLAALNGWVVNDNHTYGTGKSGIATDGGTLGRIANNYIEYWGQSATVSGEYAGILAQIGGGKGCVISSNVLDLGTVTGIHAATTIRGIKVLVKGTDTCRCTVMGNRGLGLAKSTVTVGLNIRAEDAGSILDVDVGFNTFVGFDGEWGQGGLGVVTVLGPSPSFGVDKAAGNPGILGYIEMRQQSAAPAAPVTGRDRIYFRASDGKPCFKGADGVEHVLSYT